jgi:3-oxoacyl-[acyl-carrier protein] reductase
MTMTQPQNEQGIQNPFRLEGKVALITGASRGIGQSIAVEFAKAGAKVILSATSVDNLRETDELIKAEKKESPILTQANVSVGDEVNEVVKKALDTHGKIDILINNAGTTKDNLLALMPEKDWDDVLSTNLKSVFLFTKACTRPMVKQRSGHQYLIGDRNHRKCWPGELCRFKSRHDCFYKVRRKGTGQA